MDITYFKRYRMEIDLAGRDLAAPLPDGYRFLLWDESLLEAFAKTKYRCFCNEIDANVFPCLGEMAGCRRLMREIANKPGFLPRATWLVARASGSWRPDYCGTIQGVLDRNGAGAIQNLGIAPEHRNRGLGTCLLYRALLGFRECGAHCVRLEVTVQNDGAIRLYERLGFRTVKIVLKAAEVEYA
jgi:ribosomal protein S18 acetylase RimI-like enzyme